MLNIESSAGNQQEQLDEIQRLWRLPSNQLRLKFFLTGVLFPILCIVAVALGSDVTVDTPWQSGHVTDYIAMMLTLPAVLAFSPLIVLSMMCMTLFVIRPAVSEYTLIRVGLYMGVFLAFQFLVFVFLTSQFMTLVAALFVAPVLALVVFLICRFFQSAKKFTIRTLMILTAVVAVVAALCVMVSSNTGGTLGDAVMQSVLAVALLLMMAAPTLNLATYIRASVCVSNVEGTADFRDAKFAGGVLAWVVTWAISWKFAVDVMLIEYAKLPTSDPNCYVSSAAAHGHPLLVRSKDSGSGKVNLQMRRLKYLEFGLRAVMPKWHAIIRKCYNRFGPRLARFCRRSVWLADATYLALKPIELSAELVRWATKTPSQLILRLYQ